MFTAVLYSYSWNCSKFQKPAAGDTDLGDSDTAAALLDVKGQNGLHNAQRIPMPV